MLVICTLIIHFVLALLFRFLMVFLIVVILILVAVYYYQNWGEPKTTPKPSDPKDVGTSANPSSPLPEGSTVRCDTTGGIYKVENGKLRWYSWDAFVAAGKPAAQNVSCDTLATMQQGSPM